MKHSSGFTLKASSVYGGHESMDICFMWFNIPSQCNVYIHDTTTSPAARK